jgi:imidazolonepropionase-like amidohydrolase
VRFTIASNDDTAHERNLPYTVATAVAHGLEKAAGLRSITIDAARILGVDAKYGSIETGKSATLIVTTGDPMEVTSDVVMSFLDGREIDMSNKQTKLAEKYLERYRQEGELKNEQK